MLAENLKTLRNAKGLSQEELAIKNRRARRIWKTVAIVLISLIAINILLIALGVVGWSALNNKTESGVREVTVIEAEM